MGFSFDQKDPEEGYALKFDFSKVLSVITEATIAVTVSGDDPSPQDILDGNRQLYLAEVRQRVKGGVDQCKYTFRCVATDGTETYTLVGILPVKYFK